MVYERPSPTQLFGARYVFGLEERETLKLYVVNSGKSGRKNNGGGNGGFHLPPLFENPIMPDALQPYFGVSGYEWDAPHVAGGATGWSASALQAWMLESQFQNEHVGTALGALASFGELALLDKAGEHFGNKQIQAVARGGRSGVWLLVATRVGSALIRAATGAPDTSGAKSVIGLRGPIDEIVAAINKGDILGALKLPSWKGAKLKGLGAALDLNFSNEALTQRVKNPFGRFRGNKPDGLGVGENALDVIGADKAAANVARFASGVL